MPLTAGLIQTEMVDADRLVTQQWQVFFRDHDAAVAKAPTRLQATQILGQASAIPTTPIPTANPLPAGLYRVTAYARITTPAPTSSSLAVQLAWTDDAVTCGMTLIPAMTGNLATTTATATAMVRSDGGTPISFSTTYSAVPAAAMQYALHLLLEAVGGQ